MYSFTIGTININIISTSELCQGLLALAYLAKMRNYEIYSSRDVNCHLPLMSVTAQHFRHLIFDLGFH